jgi:hypothetical protein
VESFVCHPGLCRTDIFRKADHDKMASVITDWAQWLSGQTAESGALPVLYCTTAPELKGEPQLGFGFGSVSAVYCTAAGRRVLHWGTVQQCHAIGNPVCIMSLRRLEQLQATAAPVCRVHNAQQPWDHQLALQCTLLQLLLSLAGKVVLHAWQHKDPTFYRKN